MSIKQNTPIQALCKEMIMHGTHAYATSLDVSIHFGKMHKNVLRDIKNMECSEQFSRLNFEPRELFDSRGKAQPLIEMTRDGFAMLVMGFTGKEAARWKEAYIDAFNRMERHIRASVKRDEAAWREANADRLNAEKSKSASVHDFIKYAIDQGSKHAGWYFANFAKLVNAIAIPENPFVGPLLMSSDQSKRLSSANTACCIAIYEGMQQQMPYRDVYTYAKDQVQEHAMHMGWAIAVIDHDLEPPVSTADSESS